MGRNPPHNLLCLYDKKNEHTSRIPIAIIVIFIAKQRKQCIENIQCIEMVKIQVKFGPSDVYFTLFRLDWNTPWKYVTDYGYILSSRSGTLCFLWRYSCHVFSCLVFNSVHFIDRILQVFWLWSCFTRYRDTDTESQWKQSIKLTYDTPNWTWGGQ